MSARLVYEAVIGDFSKAITEIQLPIAKAATATIIEAANTVKTRARANIAAAGFSSGWQNALRAQTFPKGGKPSINAAAFFFHKIPYFNVFEDGATIAGKPFLWLPLPAVPLGRGKRPLTPAEFIARIGPLHSVKNKAGTPILVGAGDRSTILRASATAVRVKKRAVARGNIIGAQVPLYVGIPAVKIDKKFDVTGIVSQVNNELGSIYARNFQAQ